MPAPTRRSVAALVLALLAVLVPITAGGTALVGPAFPGPQVLSAGDTTVVGPDSDQAAAVPTDADPGDAARAVPAPSASDTDRASPATGPHATPAGRVATLARSPGSPVATPVVPPGPVLDARLVESASPSGAGPHRPAAHGAVLPSPEPGHGTPADPRGPPATV